MAAHDRLIIGLDASRAMVRSLPAAEAVRQSRVGGLFSCLVSGSLLLALRSGRHQSCLLDVSQASTDIAGVPAVFVDASDGGDNFITLERAIVGQIRADRVCAF
jgi:hypothetical protein